MIPIYIIAYNNLYFVKNMVNQLEKYTKDIHIIDNNSTYPKMIEYFKTEYKYDLIKMDKNYGHEVYLKIQMPDKYIITDPDLQLNPKLPSNFIDILNDISDHFRLWKVGFALDISDSYDMFPDTDYCHGKSIFDWECQFWENKIRYKEYTLFKAGVDTIFCFCNKKYFNYRNHHEPAMRIAGNFTAKHLPWYIDTWVNYPRDEYYYFKENNIASTILKLIDRWIG